MTAILAVPSDKGQVQEKDFQTNVSGILRGQISKQLPHCFIHCPFCLPLALQQWPYLTLKRTTHTPRMC